LGPPFSRLAVDLWIVRKKEEKRKPSRLKEGVIERMA